MLEVSLWGVLGSGIILAIDDMTRVYYSVFVASNIWLVTMLILAVAGLMASAFDFMVDDCNGIMVNVLRPASGALALIMGFAWANLAHENSGTLVQQYAAMIFAGMMCVASTFLFVGLTIDGVKGTLQSIKSCRAVTH